MDIPKRPGSLPETSTQPVYRSDTTKPVAPVAIETLKLEAGRAYIAMVLGKNEAITKADSPAGASAPSGGAGETNAALSDKLNQNLWLLRLNGKTITIETDIALKAGQQLQVIYRPGEGLVLPQPTSATAPGTDPTRSIDTLLKAISQIMPRQVSLEAGLTTLQAIAGADAGVKAPTEVQSQARLLQNILIASLPQKASLLGQSQAIADGQPVNPTGTTANPFPDAVKYSANRAADLQPKTSSAPGSAAAKTSGAPVQALIQAIAQSGLFFESGLRSASAEQRLPDSLLFRDQSLVTQSLRTLSEQALSAGTSGTGKTMDAFIDAMSQVISQRMATDASHPGSAPVATPENSVRQNAELNRLLQNNSELMQQISRLLAARSSTALQSGDDLARSIQKLSQSLSTSFPQSLIPPAAQHAHTPASDLKGTLMTLVAALSASSAKPEAETPAKTGHIEGLAQNELMKFMFDFPHNLSMTASAKQASTILADQELTTGQLLKLMASMLNRIQFNQLNSLYQSQTNTSDTTVQQSFFIELPIVQGQQVQSFQIRIDKETQREKDEKQAAKKAQWQVSLSFNLESLGPVHVQVKLSPPAASSILWADQKDTHALLMREREQFRAQLRNLGLEVGEIICQHGQPSKPHSTLQHNLVDIKA